ncbi:MAG TPA: tetratricopeptide repeat-containing diguanylate cyclase [Thermoanaerobaculia bacterium]|nr:tetratricopeptide repeat-containing diguanylate cyclase [Thermoanaerobaculia bacterium]
MRFTLVAGLVCVLCVASARAAGVPDLAKMLDESEQIHISDKTRSWQLLRDVERTLTPASDPRIAARVQLLECKWADDPASAYRAFAKGMALAERAGDGALRVRLLMCRADAMQFEGKPMEAEREYRNAIAIAQRLHDARVEAMALVSLGWLQYNRGEMADALSSVQTAYRISVRLGDHKTRLESLSIMANVYADANVAQYDRAIEYYKQLAGEYEQHGQPNDVADNVFNIGSTYEVKGDFAAAEFHYRRALAMFQKLAADADIAYTRRALGAAVMKQGRTKEALSHFNDALAFYTAQGNAGNIAWVKQFRGMAYRRLGRSSEALRDLDAARAYFESEKNARYLEKNTEETSLVYEQLGDWRNAYDFRKRYGALQQELAVARRDELSSRLRVEFDAEKKEHENRALARENALRAAALHDAQQNQRLQLAVIILTALLATALALLFWRQVVNTRRMRAMAMTDELTRLPNRRHILAALEIVFAEAKRHAQRVALIVLDIDRFKRINDTYGHAAGDEVLKAVARTCRLSLRPSDQLGRIGGEEFLIVLQAPATAEQANEVAERLRTSVEQLDVSSIDKDLRITISLGVWITNDYDAKTAIAAADELLYRAKESGRNRVETAVA